MNPGVEEVRLSLPHIELAAHLFGPEDGLPVIALHGWLDNANSFARLAPKLKGLRIVALDMGESYPGILAVASPVLSNDRAVLGAISIAGPSGAMDPERVAPLVRAAGTNVSRRLTAA